MMEYSAGLILICRYYEASNILIIAKEINDKLPLEKRWKNKYIIWGLMGTLCNYLIDFKLTSIIFNRRRFSGIGKYFKS